MRTATRVAVRERKPRMGITEAARARLAAAIIVVWVRTTVLVRNTHCSI
jgi:hypothetical protein